MRSRSQALDEEHREILEAIASGKPLNDCLTRLTEAASRLLTDARAGLVIADPSRTVIAEVIGGGVPRALADSIKGRPINEMTTGPCAKAISTAATVTGEDIAGSEIWSGGWKEACLAQSASACHSTPVVDADGNGVGSFVILFDLARAPDAWDRRIGEFGAHIAGIAIERERTVQALRDSERRQADEAIRSQNQRLSVLSRASSQLLLAEHHDERLLNDVFSEVARTIGTELFFNFLTNDEPRTLRLFTSGGLTDAQRAQFATISFGEYLCGTVAERREVRVVDNLEASVFPEAEALRRAGVRCYAGLPLIAHDRLIGTIAYATTTRSKFRDGELQLVQSVCDQVAATLDRARLFSDLEASEKRIRHITESMPQKVFTADAAGNVDYFNHQWVDFTGLSLEAIRDWGWTQFIHPDDLAENLRLWQHSIDTGTPLEFTHRFRRADGEWRWHLSRAHPLRDTSGNVVMWAGANTDIHEQKALTETLKQRETALMESEHRFRHMADHAPVMVWVSEADGSCSFLSHSWYEFTGQTPETGLGFGWLDAAHPDDRSRAEDLFKTATDERTPFRLEYRVRRRDGVYRWAIDAATPRVGADGRFLGFIGSVIDITERKQAETTQQLLIGELSHRVKNMLANVQSIMHQTLRRTPDPTAFAAAFSGRLQSLSRVHSLLSDTTWQGADMRLLVRDQLVHGPVDETRVSIQGPHLQLEPQMALHLALMLHELGTNAIKYGAHSTASGRVSVVWAVEENNLLLTWTERGGPQVSAPRKKGFGSALIESSAKAVGGSARMRSAAEGISWTVELSLPSTPASSVETSQLVAIGSLGSSDPTKAKPSFSLPLHGRRVLVVEDEPLIGLEIVSQLEELGVVVTGPLSTERAALEAIQSTPLDMALLDANLSGRPVDRIAAALTRANVPFVFVTGYARENLPASFRSAPVLSKPFTSEQLRDAAQSLLRPDASITRLTR